MITCVSYKGGNIRRGRTKTAPAFRTAILPPSQRPGRAVRPSHQQFLVSANSSPTLVSLILNSFLSRSVMIRPSFCRLSR